MNGMLLKNPNIKKIEGTWLKIGGRIGIRQIYGLSMEMNPQSGRYVYVYAVALYGEDRVEEALAVLRDGLVAYAQQGGHILVEGGEVGYDAASYPGYPDFAEFVLHSIDWNHDSSGNITIDDTDHYVVNEPNVLTGQISIAYAGYGDADAMVPMADAEKVASWSSYPTDASVICSTATAMGKDLIPRVAALTDAGMASDVAGMPAANQFKRPVYAGGAYITVEVKTDVICATARQSEFDAATESAWQDIRNGLKLSFKAMQRSFEKAEQNFKKDDEK